MKKKILVVVGTRPNFIKITQFRRVQQNHADQQHLRTLKDFEWFYDPVVSAVEFSGDHIPRGETLPYRH